MESVLLTSNKKSDLKLLLEVAKKMGISSRPISRDEIEDWALAQEIEKGLKTATVSKESVMKALKK